MQDMEAERAQAPPAETAHKKFFGTDNSYVCRSRGSCLRTCQEPIRGSPVTRPSIYRLCLFLLFVPAFSWGGPLDDYYRARFAPPVKSVQLSASAATGERHRHGDHCRTMLLRSLKRDWDQLEPETQQVLAKQLSRPALSDARSFSSTHFTIFYAASGTDAPSDLSDDDRDGTPDWIETVADAFETVYRVEVTQMGYRAPYVSSKYQVYLRDLASESVYGYAYSEGPIVAGTNGVTSYIEIDRDFDPNVYGGRAVDNLCVTAAHEFHHAIQFGYNDSFEMWYGEATATWIEDEVFDDANQLYWYLDDYLLGPGPVPLDAGLGSNTEYGRWIFNRFLAERHTPSLIKEVWEDLGRRLPLSGGAEIPMIPLLDTALGKRGTTVVRELSAFAGTLYSGDWKSHQDDIEQIPVVPPLAIINNYPATSAALSASMLALPPYSFAYYRFAPSSTSPAHLKLELPALSSNATAVAYRKGIDGSVTSYTLDRATGSISIPYFSPGQASEVMLAVSSNGASGGVTFAFSTGAAVPPKRTLTVSFAGSGGGGINSVSPLPENNRIFCSSGASCPPAAFEDNAVVTLAATPDANSTFGGWSAPCTVTGNNCQVTLTSDVTVTPTFLASPAARIAQVGGYSLISSAYAAAAYGATIQARAVTFTEPLLFNREIKASIVGGYDAGYGTRTGLSVINGSLRIRSGTLTVNGVAVR